MESLRQWNELRGQYQQKLGRPQTAPRQVRFDLSEKYSLREFRNLREAKALELLNFTSSNLAYSEGQRTPELSTFENHSFSRVEYVEEYLCLIKPNLDIFYASKQVEKEHSGNESYEEWKSQNIKPEEENYNDYQQFLKKLNSPQVTQIIENFDEIASRRSSKGIKIEDPQEPEQKSIHSQKNKSIIENKENSHEYIDEEIKDTMSNIEKNEKELSDSSFDFNISDSYPMDSLKVSESLRDGQSRVVYLDVFECLTRPEVDIDYYSKRKRSKRSARSENLEDSENNIEVKVFEILIKPEVDLDFYLKKKKRNKNPQLNEEELKNEISSHLQEQNEENKSEVEDLITLDCLVKPETYLDYDSMIERSITPYTDNKSIHIDKTEDLSPISQKSNEKIKTTDEFQRFSKPIPDVSYHSIGKKSEKSSSEPKSFNEESKTGGEISSFSQKPFEEDKINIEFDEFQPFAKPDADLSYHSIGKKSEKPVSEHKSLFDENKGEEPSFLSNKSKKEGKADQEIIFYDTKDKSPFMQEMPLKEANETSDKFIYEMDQIINNAEKELNFVDNSPNEQLVNTEQIKFQNRDNSVPKSYETSLAPKNLLRQQANQTTQKPHEMPDYWRAEARRPMPKERDINKFTERWEFIHTYQIFQAFIFICKTHRKWINGVKAEFQRRKLANILQNWKLFKKYKIAKRGLALNKAKRIVDKWHNFIINRKTMQIYSYLYWYKSMTSKGLLGWKLVTQNLVFNKNRIKELRRRHNQRLFYNTFYAWKHMKALMQANNIPIRISTTTSVSKTHGKLREFHSIDIKIMNR